MKNKKTLGIKTGTLGIKTGEKPDIVTGARFKSAAPAVSNKGKVVVVTKGGRRLANKPQLAGAQSDLVPKEEQAKRIQLIQNATALQKQHAQKMSMQNAVEIKKQTEDEKMASKPVDSGNVDERQEEVHKVEAPDSEIKVNVIKRPKVEKISLEDIINQGKVRNLDALYRAPKPQEKPDDNSTDSGKPAQDSGATALSKPAGYLNTKPVSRHTLADKEEDSSAAKKDELNKHNKKISLTQVMMMDSDESLGVRRRSLASIRRAREKIKRKLFGDKPKVAEKIIREVNVPDFITVQELANRMAEKTSDVIKALMKLGMIVTVNQIIDPDIAELIIAEFGHKIKRVTEAEIESSLLQGVQDNLSSLLPRPPVVTIMGHVDHGKTSLLDALRNTDVVAKEAGGITQHIGAYQITLPNGKMITFLDTPGHEAFTAMRLRGAKATDIVVLVVAADDGIMQQTIEAISHAKAAKVPIIVAINKIDKPDANSQKVKNELYSHNIVPEDMGGDTIVIEVSAKQKTNLDKLEEAILLQAELLDLKANPNRSAEGVVIEAKVDKGRGVVATLLVQKGTLRIGDIVVAGSTFGKIKALLNDKGKPVSNGIPSSPIEIFGLEVPPVAGDECVVVPDEFTARKLVGLRLEREKQKKLVASKSVTLEALFKKAKVGGLQELPIIIKADVQGSVEAIGSSLQKLATEEIAVRVLHSAVGGITESDVALASASNALIIGFNVRANQQAKDMARNFNISIKYYSIIYNLVDDVKAAMGGMLSPVRKEEITGYVEVREVFNLTKFGKIAGSYVTEGSIKRTSFVRLIRDSVVIYEGKLKALKRFKDDVKEVNTGFECGLSFENFEDIKVNDKVEAFNVTEEARVI